MGLFGGGNSSSNTTNYNASSSQSGLANFSGSNAINVSSNGAVTLKATANNAPVTINYGNEAISAAADVARAQVSSVSSQTGVLGGLEGLIGSYSWIPWIVLGVVVWLFLKKGGGA